jgi:hypothetical protein
MWFVCSCHYDSALVSFVAVGVINNDDLDPFGSMSNLVDVVDAFVFAGVVVGVVAVVVDAAAVFDGGRLKKPPFIPPNVVVVVVATAFGFAGGDEADDAATGRGRGGSMGEVVDVVDDDFVGLAFDFFADAGSSLVCRCDRTIAK